MVRVNLKGGVWKNTEDEILKAGIMKYGKNNWGAIASLLHKKTPKQCKARWSEWLDPSIKKTEWTREEEEKLLHLAKIFPNQWRTIAPMLQRTAHQCIEHFTYLSDLALGKDVTEAIQDPNRLRPGEIDPNPENKPARPDAIDMDEDEKEMLQEARARLANTQGKKQRRKAREKILEDARQLAQLQKLRELRAAGIDTKLSKPKRGEVDHNRDIMNYHAPAPGSFDISADRAREAQIQQSTSFVGKTIKDIEGESKQEREQKARAKDIKKDQLRRQTDLPGAIAQINKRNDAVVIRERAPLALPAPQLADEDLEAIKKHGGLAQLQQQVMQQATGAIASRPEGVSASDRIMQEARTIHALQSAQTPLQGGENVPIATPGDFSGLAPKRSVPITPSVMGPGMTPMVGMGGATPMIGMGTDATRGAGVGMGMGMTPRYPGATPMRPGMPGPGAMQPYGGATPLVGDMRAPARPMPMVAHGATVAAGRQRLQAAWARLPQAEAKYELEWPDLPPEPVVSLTRVTHSGQGGAVEVEEDLDMQRLVSTEREKAKRAAERLRESTVVQRGLLRPQQVNNGAEKALVAAAAVDSAASAAAADAAQKLVREEALRWLKYDHAKHPLNPRAAVDEHRVAAVKLEYIADKDIAHARALVQAEAVSAGLPRVQPLPPADGIKRLSDEEEVEERAAKRARYSADMDAVDDNAGADMRDDAEQNKFDVSLDECARTWQSVYESVVFSPAHRTFVSLSSLDEQGRIAALRQQYQLIAAWRSQEEEKASKLEKTLSVTLKGYEVRGKKLQGEIVKAHKELMEALVKQQSFAEIQRVEREVGAMKRVTEARTRIQGLKALESQQQEEYMRLQREVKRLQA